MSLPTHSLIRFKGGNLKKAQKNEKYHIKSRILLSKIAEFFTTARPIIKKKQKCLQYICNEYILKFCCFGGHRTLVQYRVKNGPLEIDNPVNPPKEKAVLGTLVATFRGQF